MLKGLSEQIMMGFTKFDIDESDDVVTELDVMVARKLIDKGLENDTLYFIEGGLLDDHPDFIAEEQFEVELKNNILQEKPISSGEFQQEMDEI